MSTGKVVLGLLAGMAAGATLGILFAPDKGSKTRKKIVRKGEDYAEELQEKFEGLAGQLSDKYDEVKDETEKLITKTKTKYDDLKKEISAA